MSVEINHPYLPPLQPVEEGRDAIILSLDSTSDRQSPENRTNEIEIIGEERISLGGVKRLVQTATFEDRDGIVQELRIIPRLRRKHTTNPIVLVPGCSEDITRGPARNLTNQLAILNPGSDIAAVASDGLSKYGTRFTTEQILRRGFPEIGSARARMAGVFANGDPLNFVAESMGAVEVTHAIQANMKESVAKIEAVVMHSDGFVTPNNVPFRMIGAFMPMLAVDMALTATMHPVQTLHNMDPRTDLLRPKSWAAIGSQVVHLIAGMEKELISEAAEKTSHGFIKGRYDALYQPKLLNWLKARHPKTVDVQITGGGHAALWNYIGAANKIQDEFKHLAHLRGED